MSEFSLPSSERVVTAAAMWLNRLALGGMAKGIVARGLPKHTPEVYEQRLADAGEVVFMVDTELGAPVAETLVYYGPEPPEPIVYV